MPVHDEDIPRLAEIARTLTDFRAEFRNAMTEVVRKDVYSAHMASMQLQLDTLREEIRRILEERNSDRRETRKAFITAGLSVAVAVIMLIVQFAIK